MKYRVGNWSEYNRNLKNRGNLTIWVSEDAIDSWMVTNPENLKGRPNHTLIKRYFAP